jgi:hypothetical protein
MPKKTRSERALVFRLRVFMRSFAVRLLLWKELKASVQTRPAGGSPGPSEDACHYRFSR